MKTLHEALDILYESIGIAEDKMYILKNSGGLFLEAKDQKEAVYVAEKLSNFFDNVAFGIDKYTKELEE